MNNITKKLEKMFSAAAFAEGGEFETAVDMMSETPGLARRIRAIKNEVDLSIANLTMMAVTFAEAGENERAAEIMMEVETKLEALKDDLHNEVISLSGSPAQI